MSAREELINILSGGHESNKYTMGLVADSILTRYALELIAKIKDPETRFGLGYEAAIHVIEEDIGVLAPEDPCPYDFSHTRHWCGYRECRDS